MATTTQPPKAPETPPEPSETADIPPALKKLDGWDEKRGGWVHGDPGKQALAHVNAAAKERAAKRRAAKARRSA
jgi:hypothetical protein